MILLGLYCGIWWSRYCGINLKEVNKWFWVLMILLGPIPRYKVIQLPRYGRGNKWFWILSDYTVMDHSEIVKSGICSFKQRGLFSANSLIWEWHVDLLISVGDCSCPTTHLCDVMLVQDHSKEDDTNLLRVCNTFNKYTLLSLIITGTLTVWTSVYINNTGA